MQGLAIKKVELTPEAVDNIFRTAIDAGHTYGFGYWAELKGITRGAKVGHESLIKSIRLLERDGAKPVCKLLTRKDLEDAIAKILSSPNGMRLSGIDEEYPDGPASEYILQFAMFGEQVYG